MSEPHLVEPGTGPPSVGGSPDVAKTARVVESPEARSTAVVSLALLAYLYTIYFARSFLLPITFALLLNFLFSPVVRTLRRARVPAPAAAAFVVLSFVIAVGAAGYVLIGPMESWITHAPETMRKVESRLRVLAKPVDQVTRVADQVEKVGAADASPTREVVVKGPTLASRLFGTTQMFAQDALEVILLLYFLLAAGDLFLEKLVQMLPRVRDKRTAVNVARAIESSISTYLVTVAVINLTEGSLVALAMWLLGMPTPLLWGALVACLEFIPYVGMAVAVAVLAVAGLSTFDSLGHALAAPGIFIGINFIQGNVVTPLVMGKRLTLNPVALFVGLAFWWWVWGIPGALIAVPTLAAFKILCDHVEALAPLGVFLAGRDTGERPHYPRSDSPLGSDDARQGRFHRPDREAQPSILV